MEEVTSFFTRFSDNLGRKFEPQVRHHLAKVYVSLFATSALAAIGAVCHVKGILEFGLLAAFASFGLVLAMLFTYDDGKNLPMRLSFLLAFGFFSGQSIGPLLEFVIAVNPQIIVTALMGTCIVFVSFSLSALFAEQGKYLFLGGVLGTIINTMFLASVVNIFAQSAFVSLAQLYIGLGVMSAFILYDTQKIIEKARMGDKDIVKHSLELFFDLVSIFRRLLIILTRKEVCEKKNKKRE